LGGVRLISSARITFAKTGPCTNRSSRCPVVLSSSITSVPVMSARHQVRRELDPAEVEAERPAIVEISSVFASPGTPTTSACPRQKIAIRISARPPRPAPR
jgi:hypothetical protein